MRNRTAPPLSEATRQLMSQRRVAPSAGDRDTYKELNRRVRAAVLRHTRDQLLRRIRDSGRGSLWRSIRPVIAAKQPARPAPSADRDSMNRQFVSVGTRVARQVDSSEPELPVRLTRVTTGRFEVSPVSPECLTDTVARMTHWEHGVRGRRSVYAIYPAVLGIALPCHHAYCQFRYCLSHCTIGMESHVRPPYPENLQIN